MCSLLFDQLSIKFIIIIMETELNLWYCCSGNNSQQNFKTHAPILCITISLHPRCSEMCAGNTPVSLLAENFSRLLAKTNCYNMSNDTYICIINSHLSQIKTCAGSRNYIVCARVQNQMITIV